MSQEQPVMLSNARTLTAGYSDSEDRLWLRFGGDETAVQMWLTRALLGKLLTSVWGYLADTVEAPQVASPSGAVRAEREVALEEKPPMTDAEARVKQPQAMSHKPVQAGLIASVHLKRVGNRTRVTFSAASGQVMMSFDRPGLHQMLNLLSQRAETSKWGLGQPWSGQS
ncbi:MAG: hypothetical protein RIS35_1576 [Pseudomonadota bacterium]|jgi:hypothetical protein